jgi:hypothetical protein
VHYQRFQEAAMKRIIVGSSLAAFLVAGSAFACNDKEDHTTAKKENKAPTVAKAAKKPVKTEVRKGEKKS